MMADVNPDILQIGMVKKFGDHHRAVSLSGRPGPQGVAEASRSDVKLAAGAQAEHIQLRKSGPHSLRRYVQRIVAQRLFQRLNRSDLLERCPAGEQGKFRYEGTREFPETGLCSLDDRISLRDEHTIEIGVDPEVLKLRAWGASALFRTGNMHDVDGPPIEGRGLPEIACAQ